MYDYVRNYPNKPKVDCIRKHNINIKEDKESQNSKICYKRKLSFERRDSNYSDSSIFGRIKLYWTIFLNE